MTSSSDSDFPLLRRRLFVHGIPPRTSPGSLKAFFSTFGSSVSGVHNSMKGSYAFITFEEEEEAAMAAVRANGAVFQGRVLHVEFAHALNHPSPPVIGARRCINFPKPFGARGGVRGAAGGGGGASTSYSFSGVGDPSTSSSSSLPRWRPSHEATTAATTGAGRGTRNGRARGGCAAAAGGGQRHQRAVRQQQPYSHKVRVIHCDSEERHCEEPVVVLEEQHCKLFSSEIYPHVAKKLFLCLDAVSLMRCKLVCKTWRASIKHLLEDSPRLRSLLRSRWMSAHCSLYPVTPSTVVVPSLLEENPDSSYRNVLGLKCDELEIVLAVDNGNVEIYDRHSLRLKTVLVGQFSSSPSSIDFNQRIILVGYTCGFGRVGGRRVASCWNVYDRSSKQLLHSIERDGDDAIRIGFSCQTRDSPLMLATPSAFYLMSGYEVEGGPIRTKKIFTVSEPDTVESFDLDHAQGFLAGVVRREQEQLALHVWRWPRADDAAPAADADSNLVVSFPLLEDYAASSVSASSSSSDSRGSFRLSKCKCLSVQLRYPRCLVFFSNAYGFFEYFEDRGRPYSLLALYDVLTKTCLRTITVDQAWMTKHAIVSFDYDSGILSAKFDDDHLVLGMGSYSDRKDGGIAVWTMDEVLGDDSEFDLSVSSLPAPTYHWAGWDGHTGGVHALHLDRLQLIAVNACVHQVVTRCIEGGDESRKDNVLVYDFWSPGYDGRRCGGNSRSRRTTTTTAPVREAEAAALQEAE